VITGVTIKDGMLWVGAEGRDHRGLPIWGHAQTSMPPWASRPAILAMLDAAMIEAEEAVQRQVAHNAQEGG
jgi:hypothetical protein